MSGENWVIIVLIIAWAIVQLAKVVKSDRDGKRRTAPRGGGHAS